MLANRIRRGNCPILAFFEDMKPSLNFKLSQIKNNVKRLTAIKLSLFNSKNLFSPTSRLISLLAIKLQSKDFLFWSSTVAISLQPAVFLHFSKHSAIKGVLNVSKAFLRDTLDGVLTKNSAMKRFTFNKNRIIQITIPFILKKAYVESA